MCGRYVFEASAEELARALDATAEASASEVRAPSYNVAPTTRVLGVALDDERQRVLGAYRWGLVPSWAKDASVGSRMFNARAETVAAKPSFRSAFVNRRCGVVASGYYEWRRRPGSPPEPVYLVRADGKPMVFAGLFEYWRDDRPGALESMIRSCTIITTAAPAPLDEIHDRVPLLLADDVVDVWLDRELKDRDELHGLLTTPDPTRITYRRIDRRVGDVHNNDASLLDPVE